MPVHRTTPPAPCKSNPRVARVGHLPFAALPHDLAGDGRLTATAVRLALILCRFARGKPSCWPSVATLAAELRRSRRTVQLALRQLEAAGWLRAAPAGNPTGRVLILAWRLPAPGGATAGVPGAQATAPAPAPPVAPESEKGGEGNRPAAASARIGGPPPPAAERRETAPPAPPAPAAPVRTAEQARAHYAAWLELPAGSPLRLLAERRVRELAAQAASEPPPCPAPAPASSRSASARSTAARPPGSIPAGLLATTS